MIKASPEFKNTLKTVIKFARRYFPKEATQEMLDKWLPLLCPTDRSINMGMRYLALFLPSTSDVDPAFTYTLWFKQLMTLWNAFSNSPSWEVELFQLYSRLAYHNVGRIDWSQYIDVFFNRIMISLDLPCSYANSGIKLKFGITASSSLHVICR